MDFLSEANLYKKLMTLAHERNSLKVSTLDGERLGHPDVDFVMFSYLYADPALFETDFGRDTRGITFAVSKKFPDQVSVVLRPFHKFFNLGEEYAPSLDSLKSKSLHVADKIDGSLLQVSDFRGKPLIASRSTLDPDTSYVVKAYHRLPEDVKEAINNLAASFPGMTHMFELVDPQNMIVIQHKELEVRYLVSRNNKTGEYVPLQRYLKREADLLKPVTWSASVNLEDLMNRQKTEVGVEGWVVSIGNPGEPPSEFIKLKTAWYFQLHKLTTIRTPKTLIEAYLNEDMDDLISEICMASESSSQCKTLRKIKHILDEFREAVLNDTWITKHLSGKLDMPRKDLALKLQALSKEEGNSFLSRVRFSAIMSSFGLTNEEKLLAALRAFNKTLKKNPPQELVDRIEKELQLQELTWKQ